MGQGGTWRRGSLCPGWLQECLSCCVSVLQPQVLHPQRLSGHEAELDAGPQREALLCMGPTAAFAAGLLADTHSGLVTHTGERVTGAASSLAFWVKSQK